MCGRYVIKTPPELMRETFGYAEQPNFPPRYNVAPTQPIPVVRLDNGRRSFALVRWGLIPAWVKDPRGFSLLINARAESVLDKPAFRNAMRRRRCLVPADGFYEWKQDGARKRPFYAAAKGLVAFAGLWEPWIGPNGEEVETACIVTTAANRTLAGAARPHAGGDPAAGVRSLARLRQRRCRDRRGAAGAGAGGYRSRRTRSRRRSIAPRTIPPH